MVEHVHGGLGRYEAVVARAGDAKEILNRSARCEGDQGTATCSSERAWALATAVEHLSALVQQLNDIEQEFVSMLDGVAGVELARTGAKGCSQIRRTWKRYALELQSAS